MLKVEIEGSSTGRKFALREIVKKKVDYDAKMLMRSVKFLFNL